MHCASKCSRRWKDCRSRFSRD